MMPFKKGSLLLAPMAGVTDSAFRCICRKYGCDGTFAEMVSTKGIFYKDKKSSDLLNYTESEQPISLQIFGSDIECFKVATDFINKNYSPVSIDINMGCPAPKIFNNGDGCALMGKPELAYEIIKSVKENTNTPVSVKFRSGINDLSINAVKFACICEDAGADFITVHGRTREQFYNGKSDPCIIKEVVEAVKIPVIANGDITDYKSAQSILEFTGSHSLMIGRGAMGNPLVFSQIKKASDSPASKEQLFKIALEHLSLSISNKGELLATKEFRKHLLWYLKGVRGAAKFKVFASNVSTFSDCERIFEKVLKDIIE